MNYKRSRSTTASLPSVVMELKNTVFKVEATRVSLLPTLPVREQGCCQLNKHSCTKSVWCNCQWSLHHFLV